MSSKDAHLYGIPRSRKPGAKDISSSSSLAFSSQLSTLIANSKGSQDRSASGRLRPKKEDIFTTHNKGTKKRALKDIDDADFGQKHSTSSEPLDEATWHRSKKIMEEKARLYNALKRGEIEDLEDRYGVDFDRKWAEAQDSGRPESDTSEGEDDGASDEELIDYIDEFGRSRKGTRAEAAREALKKETKEAAAVSDRFTARPLMPSNVLYGDTIQSAAFNPDETIAEKMAEIAAKRDKITPPPDEHFDSKKEIRTKGVSFFQFSADSDERQRQMANLEAERSETERRRAEAMKRKEERKKTLEARRQKIQNKRTTKQTDQFLDNLTGELLENWDSIPQPDPA